MSDVLVQPKGDGIALSVAKPIIITKSIKSLTDPVSARTTTDG